MYIFDLKLVLWKKNVFGQQSRLNLFKKLINTITKAFWYTNIYDWLINPSKGFFLTLGMFRNWH